ncbi:MAG TPA: TonB-dependent receptor [Gammaproteobacteria bacterium]|jgi:iron complex outermembrane receptor protein|nr:TonB-dependent receptor [Gammaproteobacteria bacterium]
MDIRFPHLTLVCLVTGLAVSPLAWSDDQAPEGTQSLGAIEVTATPMPEHLGTVPQSIDVITHDQLVALGAVDLRSALALTAGVDIGPGGDNGPAASVPQFQGLAEFDAFLLLVDGVPVGGAFNPDLATVDLTGVDRIEIIRGSAPVKYGATSFVGVINVIHIKAGAPGSQGRVSVGSYGSHSVGVALPLTQDGAIEQSLIADYTRQGFSDDRAEWGRSHVLLRNSVTTSSGEFRLDVDGLSIRQDPASPRPLAPGDTELTPLVPEDSNDNPSDARMDEDRVGLTLADDADLKWAEWSTVFSTVFTHQRNIRGFLRSDSLTDTGAPNADGFNQTQDRTDIYFDSHLTFPVQDDMHVVTGFSLLQGSGSQASSNFEYFVHLDGANPPPSTSVPVDERTRLSDRRTFSGLYASMDWAFAPKWDFQFGLQLNHDVESTDTAFLPSDPAEQAELDGDHRSDTRFSGLVALSYEAWTDGADDMVIYGNYRNTYKPAAIDFGPEAEPDILEPETAQAYEFGVKGILMQGALDWEASTFLTDMNNTVVAVNNGGTPGIANGGKQRFEGVELEADWRIAGDWRWQVAYSYHKATYRDFLHDTDGTPAGLVQDAGNRLELSPMDLFSTGLFYMPVRGFTANAVLRYVGSRYFDPENSVSTPAYTTFDAGVGYRFETWSLNLQGRNLNDRRDPVSNSELGDSQSYLLPARFIELSAGFDF